MWFKKLTGFEEISPEHVRANMEIRDGFLISKLNHRKYHLGDFELVSLTDLRQRALELKDKSPTKFQQSIGDIKDLHIDPTNHNALFQVASQFNLLEMISPNITPEDGIDRYENDLTQGPACAISAGAATIYRQYFLPLNGRIGQSKDNQQNCLDDVERILGNKDHTYWEFSNGYIIDNPGGLERLSEKVAKMDEAMVDRIRCHVKFGIHWNTEVTTTDTGQTVSQILCSAIPVSYALGDASLWLSFAKIILEACYEASLAAAVINKKKNNVSKVYLTLVGGGDFGNPKSMILSAIRRALDIYKDCGLDVYLLSYRELDPEIESYLPETKDI